jgi:hypothetical protein
MGGNACSTGLAVLPKRSIEQPEISEAPRFGLATGIRQNYRDISLELPQNLAAMRRKGA